MNNNLRNFEQGINSFLGDNKEQQLDYLNIVLNMISLNEQNMVQVKDEFRQFPDVVQSIRRKIEIEIRFLTRLKDLISNFITEYYDSVSLLTPQR